MEAKAIRDMRDTPELVPAASIRCRPAEDSVHLVASGEKEFG
jgi:hypothetical protein